MAQDFGDDVGDMLFRFMERNAENLMQEYAKTLVHQTVLGWYQARAERMGLSKEEAAYLAKAMANKEQACVPFGNKNDAAYLHKSARRTMSLLPRSRMVTTTDISFS